MEEIFTQVESETGVTRLELLSKRREKKLATARARFIELANNANIHPKEIGDALERDRTTIIYHLRPKFSALSTDTPTE